MNIFTYDLEVQNHRYNKRVAGPFCPDNYVVQIGWKLNNGKPQEQYYTEFHRDNVLPVDVINKLQKGDIINGFNIKFDLLWVWREPCLVAAFKRGVRIYDGQYAEYLLGGMTQDVQMISMNQTAEQYGGGCKIDAVKEMWENGALTSEIPRGLLTDYLIGDGESIVGDVENTYKIMVGQVKRMTAEQPKEFKKMINFRFDGLLATTEMEYNGMYVDQQVAEDGRKLLAANLQVATKELEEFIPELPEELTFSWGSPQQKSCLIFGGTVKYGKWTVTPDENGNTVYVQQTVKQPLFTVNGETQPIPLDKCILAGGLYVLLTDKSTENSFEHKGNWYIVQDTYKSGKNKGLGKFKNVKQDDKEKPKGSIKDHYFTFSGYTAPNPRWAGKATDAKGGPLYSTNAETINALSTRGIPFTDTLAKFTKYQKDLSTYYWVEDDKGSRKGMLTLVGDDNVIHHALNHTSTVTGRMSSSNPNLQNIPRGDTSNVKKMFTSRFGVNGRMAEIDYSQLEVVVQGVLTKDKQLCEDLNNRVDFHCKRLATKLGEDYGHVLHKCKVENDELYGKMRTGAKAFSFQRAYGAGVAAIVLATGMSKTEVEALVSAEETLYPTVKKFDQVLELHINNNATKSGGQIFHNGIAFNQKQSTWNSPTGTMYKWKQGITPEFMHEKGKYTGFSPTERKNYPVQGEGGFIMQTMLGIVWRYFVANDYFNGDVLLVNSVHDCLLLDGRDDKTLKPVREDVHRILETVPTVFNNAYPELKVSVPFPVETEVGHDLFNMTVEHLPKENKECH
jgi:DNA polymerase-1